MTDEQEQAQERTERARYSTGITPETTAALIEALASDRAVRLKTMSKATVVLATMPVWVRAEEANALFGTPLNKLTEWVIAGKVVAKKCDPFLKGSATIFKTETILRTIDGLCDYRRWLLERPDLKGEERERWMKNSKEN